MEYITEIKAFYNLTVDNPLSTGQIALWHALMYINNKCHWTKDFTVSNTTLQLYTGLSIQGLIKARNSLKQKGLIDFTAGSRGQATAYTIKTLSNSVTKSVTNGITTVELSRKQKCNKQDNNSLTLKRQKTKTKDKDSINPFIPFEGKLLESVNTWLAYKAERGQKYKPTGLKTLFKKIQDGVDEYGETAVIGSINNSIANNWQGLFFEQKQTASKSDNPFFDMLKNENSKDEEDIF